jgi:hypothetical protein
MALGGDQELIAALRAPSGEVWGALGLYREPGQPMFDDEELFFVRAVAPSLAEGARRGLLVGEAVDPEGPDAPGLVVLSANGEVEPAHPARIAPLLMSAYGLTGREQNERRALQDRPLRGGPLDSHAARGR